MTEFTNPKAWITSATFSDGAQLNFGESDIVVFVGPNNAGKSASLRDLRNKLQTEEADGIVIQSVTFSITGSKANLREWFSRNFKRVKQDGGEFHYRGLNATVADFEIESYWSENSSRLNDIAKFFCYHIEAEARLSVSNPVTNIAFEHEPLVHPIHYLYKFPITEKKASNYFSQAFKKSLLVHRSAGTVIPLYVGEKPSFDEGEGELSVTYQAKIASLMPLQEQGDGMRSFVGVLLFSLVSHYPIVLLDEPEAFLHPPQARLLGRMLAKELKETGERQLFIATHSGDVLRGLLDASAENIRVIRLQREGDSNKVSELSNENLLQLWGDPTLRYSNVLDGVFHEHVVVCEGDSDCRFYNALLDAMYEGQPEKTLPDVMFMHGGGKHAIPALVSSLRALNVPVTVVADFDVLNDSNPLRPVFESLGGNWDVIMDIWRRVKLAIDGKKPQLTSKEVKSEIEKVIAGIDKDIFPKEAATQIRDVLKVSSPWANAKSSGKAFIPTGDATREYMALNDALRAHRCFVVEVGELEGFVRSIGGSNKPQWLNDVLKKDLLNDEELEAARKFVHDIFAPLEVGKEDI